MYNINYRDTNFTNIFVVQSTEVGMRTIVMLDEQGGKIIDHIIHTPATFAIKITVLRQAQEIVQKLKCDTFN